MVMLMILTMEVLAIVATIDKQTGVLLFGDAFFFVFESDRGPVFLLFIIC